MPTLYIVATPIGNLEDISMRALRILGEVDFILCEDTRVTRVLLDHYNIKTRTISYHQHSGENRVNEIIDLLVQGKNLALVSDAGTPGISDPGGKLVQAVINVEAQNIVPVLGVGVNGHSPVQIESVPGPSAVTAALSISGIPTDKFVFMGFPPHKKGRQTFIRKILESDYPVVVYESKHRIIKFLQELQAMAEENLAANKGEANNESEIRSAKGACLPARQGSAPGGNYGKSKLADLTSVVVCRELSKMHETVYRGDLKSIREKIKADKNDQKGEFTVIVGK